MDCALDECVGGTRGAVWTSVLEQVMKINMQGVNVENQILITGSGPAGLALSAELSLRRGSERSRALLKT